MRGRISAPSEAHRQDVRAVLAEVRKRYPGLPLFLVGTSRGTLSVAYLAAALDGEIAGAVQTSTLFFGPGRFRPAVLVVVRLVDHQGAAAVRAPRG